MPRKKPRTNLEYNWHHRKPKVKGGSGKLNSPNMVEVRVDHHRAYHLLFGTENPTEVARILTETWIDPDWELIARRKP